MHRDVAVLGIGMRFESDDAGLLDAAIASFRPNSLEAAAGQAELLVRLRLGMVPEEGDVGIRVDGGRLSVSADGAWGLADAGLRRAEAVVAPALAADWDRLGAEVIDPLVLFLVTRRGRLPLHAAAAMAGDTALLLAGPSGTGKSTLALAALRRGLPVLSDDTVYLQLEPRLRVWGLPRPIHVLPGGALRGGTAAGEPRLRAGRWKVPVDAGAAPPPAKRALLFLLERGDAVDVRPVGVGDAVRRVEETLEPGFDHFRAEIGAAVSAIASAGAWSVTLSLDPDEALDAMLEAARLGISLPSTSA